MSMWTRGLFLATLTAGPALSQPATAPATQQQPQQKAKDPNEIVCERQKEIGSRLAMLKVCHTRAEWADLRAQDRQDIDRVQNQRGIQGK